jgi:hypothetical protein
MVALIDKFGEATSFLSSHLTISPAIFGETKAQQLVRVVIYIQNVLGDTIFDHTKTTLYPKSRERQKSTRLASIRCPEEEGDHVRTQTDVILPRQLFAATVDNLVSSAIDDRVDNEKGDAVGEKLHGETSQK